MKGCSKLDDYNSIRCELILFAIDQKFMYVAEEVLDW